MISSRHFASYQLVSLRTQALEVVYRNTKKYTQSNVEPLNIETGWGFVHIVAVFFGVKHFYFIVYLSRMFFKPLAFPPLALGVFFSTLKLYVHGVS